MIDGARKVFDEVGFVEARVADIASASGVSHGSFYTYFDSKEDILVAVAETVFEELEQAARLYARAEDPIDAVSLVNAQYFRAWQRNRKLLMTVDQVVGFVPEILIRTGQGHRLQVSRYEAVLSRMQDEGMIDADIDAYHAACALASMVDQSLRWWIGREEPYDREVALDTLNKLWVRAIGLRSARVPDAV